MSNLYINLVLLIAVSCVMSFILFRIAKFNKYQLMIICFLVVFWTMMYMQKSSPKNQIQISDDLGPWAWPIIASLYQLTQAATRVPYGKLSQKLGSRNNIIQISFFLVLVSLTLMIGSGISTWSMVVAAVAMGQFGATFGLDSQYISENYNIKKVFTSSTIAFAIPIIGSLMASTIYSGFEIITFNDKTYYWIIFAILIIGLIGLILYSLVKEKKETIHLDNVIPEAQDFAKRGAKDIAAVSITAGLLAFTYNFVLSFGSFFKIAGYWSSAISVVGFISSALVGLVFKKYLDGRFIRIISLSSLGFSTSMAALLLILGDMNITAWIILMFVASIAFGMYVMALFGAALHFDHKHPALVLGIFLSVKSFTLGTSTLSSKMIQIATPSNEIIGIIILSVSILGVLSTLIASMFIINKVVDNDVDKLINDSFNYEKLVTN